MDPRQRGPIGLVIVAILVGACGGAGSPTPSPVGVAGAPAASEPAASSPGPSGSLATGAGAAVAVDPAQVVTPAPASKPLPVATPAPTPTPVSVATTWTRPRRVGTLKTCSTVTAGIDAANRAHVAAECGGSIRYYASTDGRSWSTTVFAHPAHREDLDPQIAFQGNLVYVAYTRIAPDGGCGGGRGEAIGVFVRSRSLPDGAWSTARRIGRPGDTLEVFRVEGATIHATVWNNQGDHDYGGHDQVDYEMLVGSVTHRYRIPGAVGRTAMRIGSDGHARIAYETGTGIRFATFTGAGFATTRITRSNSGEDVRPALVLDSHDDAHILWTRKPGEGGCATRDTNPDDGTYYSTNAGGAWTSQRITKSVGETSLQVDPASGRIHALVSGRVGIWYFTNASQGSWTAKRILAKGWVNSPLIRRDPATGRLLVVYLGGPDGTQPYAMTGT